MSPSLCVVFDFFHHCHIVLKHTVLLSLWQGLSLVSFIIFVAMVNEIFFLTSLSDISL